MGKPKAKTKSRTQTQLRVRLDSELMSVMEGMVGPKNSLNALINEACRRVYLPGGMESSLEALARALTAQAGRQRHLELRQQVQLETMIIFIRQWFTANPQLPAAERRAAGAAADARLSKLLDTVADTVGRDTSILGRSIPLNDLLFPAPPAPAPGNSNAPGNTLAPSPVPAPGNNSPGNESPE